MISNSSGNGKVNSGSGRSKINRISLFTDSICIYRNLLQDPVVSSFHSLVKCAAGFSAAGFSAAGFGASGRTAADNRLSVFTNLYGTFVNLLARLDTKLNFYEYIVEKVILDENPFTISASSIHGTDPEETLLTAVRSDLDALQAAAALSPAEIKACFIAGGNYDDFSKDMISGLPEWKCRPEPAYGGCKNPHACIKNPLARIKEVFSRSERWEENTGALSEFHHKDGCGVFARYRAFAWQRNGGCGSLTPIPEHDPVRLSDLIAYENEREEVIHNTEQLLKGYPANNVLLYGDRGTGKSSTVKAILNEYRDEGLRMIEVPKVFLPDFPEIIKGLSGRNLKFIIFVDDLSFEDNDESYTSLKAILEGGLEVKPQNVVIYATSNRRHLVREKFSDRSGLQYGSQDDEIRAADTLQEKLSLSDRFGITVVFSSPDKNKYLQIVDELALRKGISMDRETLRREAMKWELWYNGRSPRTACQFINWLEGAADK